MIFRVAKSTHELNITLSFLPLPPQHFAINGRRPSLKLIARTALSPSVLQNHRKSTSADTYLYQTASARRLFFLSRDTGVKNPLGRRCSRAR